jgi:glutathione peroxidase
MPGIYDFSAKSLAGEEVPLKRFEGKVLLIVNTASACGFTPQYKGLEALHRELSPRGFAVLGFPCNQFGAQEPGSEAEIAAFCESTYAVSFPLSAKLEVNGAGRHPLYAHLTSPETGIAGDISWNFEKFLIGRDGRVLKRYPPETKPEDRGLMQDIADAL